jgi:hypothetical protein
MFPANHDFFQDGHTNPAGIILGFPYTFLILVTMGIRDARIEDFVPLRGYAPRLLSRLT